MASGCADGYWMEGFLVVDDRDGGVLAEIADAGEALRVLAELQQEHSELADALCLVRFERRRGAVLATETTTRVRTLDFTAL